MSKYTFEVRVPNPNRLIAHWPFTLLGCAVAMLALWGVFALLGTGILGITLVFTAAVGLIVGTIAAPIMHDRQFQYLTYRFPDWLIFGFFVHVLAPTLGSAFAAGMIATIAAGQDAFSLGLYMLFWVLSLCGISWYSFGLHKKFLNK